jgi:hypothetical protein
MVIGMYETGPSITRTPSVYLNMRDPHLLKYYYKFKTIGLMEKESISGSSPPDIFVGRFGYPNVYIGPMVPPLYGDTTILSSPEGWVGKTIPEIVEYRSMLVRGMQRENVKVAVSSKIGDMLQELALADKYTGVDMALRSRPALRMKLDENSEPFGPSAPLKDLAVGNTRANRDLEKAFFDTDMGAKDAMTELYFKGLPVSQLQKALSAGTLGRKGARKFVPTRWSITAVDDTLGRHRLESIKECESIPSPLAFETVGLDNRWLVLMFPGSWSYELVEAWYPNTTWNMESKDIAIYSSSEFFEGRKTYAEIGGCYYAARLAVSEFLDKIKAQARVVILRETHSGYIMPVGVWNVREHVRAALRNPPTTFDSTRSALGHVATKMEIPLSAWIRNSTVLRYVLHQRLLGVQ